MSGADRVARLAVASGCVFLFVLPITHTVAIRTIALGLFMACAGYAWWRERPPLPPRSLLIAMAAWAGVAAASLVWSIDFEYSQGEFRNEILYTLAAFLAFYVLTPDEGRWRLWLRVLTLSAILIAIYFLAVYWRYGMWYPSFRPYVGDRNAYSAYVTLVAPLLIVAALDRALSPVWRRAAWVALGLALVTGALTLNRIMWPALLAAGLVLLVTRFTWRAASRRARVAVVTALAAVAIGGVVQIAAISGAKTLAPKSAAVVDQLRADPRLEIWAYAVERIADRPWLGHGYGRGILRKDFRAHLDAALLWHGHNIFLNYAVSMGLVGATAFAAMLASLGYAAWRGWRAGTGTTRAACGLLLAVLAGTVVRNATDDVLVREISLLFWSIAGMALGVAARARLSLR